jgi:hypothetical protein
MISAGDSSQTDCVGRSRQSHRKIGNHLLLALQHRRPDHIFEMTSQLL